MKSIKGAIKINYEEVFDAMQSELAYDQTEIKQQQYINCKMEDVEDSQDNQEQQIAYFSYLDIYKIKSQDQSKQRFAQDTLISKNYEHQLKKKLHKLNQIFKFDNLEI
ncbi:kinesin motor domain protein (macronuclear) [Tetrahymena thermophila SB210]|uniref:Kinesin motor domain protein n=1 Tax=Tetrahymena thermophila (strain SB210) TaxID=312017 RepID=W7X7D4_TETTS|nr:kinesin motor domain protein [Tetrahymena thermophila SB210]EWS73282.1 kinesin motor domain protein [Tetrahymena thermophila SB210]|eukprot:XP_012654191.1 kinesin motor domain protein [Tetrahymena thermophila SB210]